MKIQQLEGDVSSLQRRNDSAIEEIGRLESRLQSQQIELQTENELLNTEVCFYSL